MFAAAASTCDLFGDGDALSFPIVSELIPPLELLLSGRFQAAQTMLSPAALELVGTHACGDGEQLHVAHTAGGELVASGLGAYPWTLLPLEGEQSTYRLLMRGLPLSTRGCSSPEWPGANLCHTSCFREMARGDMGLAFASRNSSGHVVSLTVPNELVECKRQ